MSFSFISRISLYLSFIFIFSCQDTISTLSNNENIDSEDYTFQLETEEFLDFSFFEQYADNVIDNYTYKASDYNFLDKDQVVLKINNYEAKYNNNELINVIYLDESIYSFNKDGELLKFDLNNGKLIKLNAVSGNEEGFYKIGKSRINRPNVFDDRMFILKSNAIIKVE